MSIELIERVREQLTPDLLHPKFADRPRAHCYVASEVIFHLLGGKDGGLTPEVIHHEGARLA